MANGLYAAAKAAILTNTLDLENGDIRALPVSADYTVDLAAHDFLDDVGAAGVATAVALANKTVAAGVFDADNTTFPAVSGDEIVGIVLYLHTGNSATAKLLAYLDTAAGLPLTPSGNDITIRWSDGANKIFKLV